MCLQSYESCTLRALKIDTFLTKQEKKQQTHTGIVLSFPPITFSTIFFTQSLCLSEFFCYSLQNCISLQ